MDKEQGVFQQLSNFKRLQEVELAFNNYIIIMTSNSDKVHKCGVFVSVTYF